MDFITSVTSIISGLSTVHGKSVIPCKFLERTQLQSTESEYVLPVVFFN